METVTTERLSRRAFLRAGALSMLLPNGRASASPGAETNCILLLLLGGPGQHDTWDPKPSAPADIRGPFAPIKTKTTGVCLTELFPRLAQCSNHFSLVRSLYSTGNTLVHTFGTQIVQTGRLSVSGIEHPHIGCVLGYKRNSSARMPSHVLLPKPLGNTGGNAYQGQSAGYLGRKHDPFLLDGDPSDAKFELKDLVPQSHLSRARLLDRQRLRESIDPGDTDARSAPPVRQIEENFQRAFDISLGLDPGAAFSLDREPAILRDRYGRSRFGQSCLLARRLVEHGVRFVTVNMFESTIGTSWDYHGARPFTTFKDVKTTLAPDLDGALSALIEDLSDRSLLGSTVVIAMGEFGRTPLINPAGGRDHHVGVWTALVAGGPFRPGRVIGESDKMGDRPKTRPISITEFLATLYHALGIDPHDELPGPRNRPISIVDHGIEPVTDLF